MGLNESYFDQRASTYGDLSWHVGYAERLVELAELPPGSSVLDAATGTGLAALAAARAIGPVGEVVGVDISAGMLREAEVLLAKSGLGNIRYQKADATALVEFSPESFDVVLCSSSVLYLDAGRALAAWHRVLKPGGMLAYSAMRAGFPVSSRVFRECAAEVGVPVADPMAALGSERASRDACEKAGFRVDRIVSDVVRRPPLPAAELWRSNARNPLNPEVPAAEARYLARMAEFADDPSICDMPVLFVIARKK
ncbi:methyltransferase domain-containing protein [Acrocarpospora macrocephala]|uniref:Methyltransferase n=1 Tax=Acrocarpospora macrocephala TaxID=150177 RepID=A0A5M3WNV5_9ACTN|nr:class I SAM-dependent methyltransferase [Acrocarpospora macrocephala]GES09829.1 methyltransferase [Acrocarpospora macrocephala]